MSSTETLLLVVVLVLLALWLGSKYRRSSPVNPGAVAGGELPARFELPADIAAAAVEEERGDVDLEGLDLDNLQVEA